MSVKKLAKKFVNDIMFQNADFCRVNVDLVSRDESKNYSKQFMIKKGEGVELLQDYDVFKVYYNINRGYLHSFYSYNNGITTFERVNQENDPIIKEYIGNNTSEVVLLTIFRYSNNMENNTTYGDIIFPVIYKVLNTKTSQGGLDQLFTDILSKFIDGSDMYIFEPIFSNTKYTIRTEFQLSKNDEQINEGFDIASTAEFFEVEDMVGVIDESTSYSWNPNTNILSVNTFNKDESKFYIDLYFAEVMNEYVIRQAKYGNLEEKIFSYSQSIIDPAECFVTGKEFYVDDHVECTYTYDPDTDKLENFTVTLDGKEVINAIVDTVNGRNTITINNVDATDGTIIYVDLGGEGFYAGPELSFSCVNTLANIISLNSFIYDYDNLYIRSIAWNLIKIR